MIQQFYPDEWLDSAYVIDYEKLYKEGYRGLKKNDGFHW